MSSFLDLIFSKKGNRRSVKPATWASVVAKELNQIAAYRIAKGANKDEWKKQSRFFKKWSVKRCKAFANKMTKAFPMSTKVSRQCAQAYIEIAMMSGLFSSHVTQVSKQRKQKEITFNWNISDKIKDIIDNTDINYIRYKPMIAPPAPWSTKEPGGYYFLPFRKTIRNGSCISQPYVMAINTLQNQEWEIDPVMLDLMRTVYDNGTKLGGLPTKEMWAIDIEPYPKQGTKEEQSSWIKRKEQVWNEWAQANSERLRMETRLRFASEVRGKTFFHAWFPDFRGRLYTACELLTPQGSAVDRCLIRFAQPVKQTERGYYWLKVHVANLWDQDKINIADRVKWTDDNMEMLRRVAMDPLSNKEWSYGKAKKNKSWERLAATRELFRTDGMTQLPIQMDGSNNGLQHWAALLRLEELGKSVNLTPCQKPQDVYAEGAAEVFKKLHGNPAADELDTVLQDHYKLAVTRDVTKRPFMCYGYGITMHSVLRYTYTDGAMDWVTNPDLKKKLSKRLGKLVWDSMNSYLNQANAGKKWLIDEVSKHIKEFNEPWVYINPLGFKMVCDYPKMVLNCSRVGVWNGNHNYHKMYFEDPTDVQDPYGGASPAAPNLIHDYDSCHAVMTINTMVSKGIHGFSFIHDSFGTYGPYVDDMREITKQEFFNLHDQDLLMHVYNQFRHSNKSLPPAKGNLDIRGVLKSDYLFC